MSRKQTMENCLFRPLTMRTGLSVVALIVMALGGCGMPPPKHFGPIQSNAIPPNEAVIFGRFVRAIDGEIKADEERSFDLLPFKDAGHEAFSKAWFSGPRIFNLAVRNDSNFYSVVERDSYIVNLVKFRSDSTRSAGAYSCIHFGFHMPEQADAYYIGTIFFDLEAVGLPLFTHRGTVRVRDEFEEASNAFKRQNPNFTGKIAKSLVIGDKSIPPTVAYSGRASRNVRPWCREKGYHIYDIVFE